MLSAKNLDVMENLLVGVEATGFQFNLFIAACDDFEVREEIIAQYAKQLPSDYQHYQLMLDQEEPSPKQMIDELKAEEPYLERGKAVISVVGSELLSSELTDLDAHGNLRSKQEVFYRYLHWTRDGFMRLPYVLVLWVTYPMLAQLARRASDFWGWRSELLQFEAGEA